MAEVVRRLSHAFSSTTEEPVRVAVLGDHSAQLVAQFLRQHSLSSINLKEQVHKPRVLSVDSMRYVLSFSVPVATDQLLETDQRVLRDVDGYLILYSVTSRDSFAQVETIYTRLSRARDEETIPVVLAGNTDELDEERCVTQEEGRVRAESLGCRFLEFSMMNRRTVRACFEEVVREYRRVLPTTNERLKKKSHCVIA